MFFRNLSIFRTALESDWNAIDEHLESFKLVPVAPTAAYSTGFVSPFGKDSKVLSHRIGDAILLTIGKETRLLPSEVVKEALAKRVAEIEALTGRKMSKADKAELKDSVIKNLLTQAFVKPSRLNVMIDTKRHLLYINTRSKLAAGAAISLISRATGIDLLAKTLTSLNNTTAVMTEWANSAGFDDELEVPMPDEFTLGSECVKTIHASETASVISYKNTDIETLDFVNSLRHETITSLQLQYGDSLRFTLERNNTITGVAFTKGAVNRLEFDKDSERAELDAKFALQSLEFGELFDTLDSALKFLPAHSVEDEATPKVTA